MKLIISVVVFNWDSEALKSCLRALSCSLDVAYAQGELNSAELWISYNGEAHLIEDECDAQVGSSFSWSYRLLLRQPNLGYGGTNNIILRNQIFADSSLVPETTVILVLNPDVWPEPDSIGIALAQLRSSPHCGLVCPRILDQAGQNDTPGHKRYPSLAVLAARLLAPSMSNKILKALNDRYEYRDTSFDTVIRGVEICSGCFMIARYDYWNELNGFDEQYFMYFEDFDLALRGSGLGWVHFYNPSVRIHHAGGGAGKKGWQHLLWFARSAWSFFSRHGWRVWKV